MRKWIVITGFPHAGQDFVHDNIINLLAQNYDCLDLGWINQKKQLNIRPGVPDEGLGLFVTDYYVKNLNQLIPDDHLLIIHCIRDIRDVFVQEMIKKRMAFEQVYNKWIITKLFIDQQHWELHSNIFNIRYEHINVDIKNLLNPLLVFVNNGTRNKIINQTDVFSEIPVKVYPEGNPNSWEKKLTMQQSAVIQSYSGKWLKDHNYEINKNIYNRRLFWKLSRVLWHLRNRTLFKRIFSDNYNASLKHKIDLEKNKEGFIIFPLLKKIKIKLYVDSLLSHYILTGQYEYDERIFLLKYLKQGDIFLDIGANIGLFALSASSVVGPKGMVYAFEPAKLTFSRLEENIKLNNLANIKAIQVAVSDKNGETSLYSDVGEYDAWNSLVPPNRGLFHRQEVVTTTTLDTFVHNSQIQKIKIIKIDVEGYEIPVLNGAEKLLRQNDAPVLIVEFTDENAENAGFTCKELFEKVRNFGYTWYRYDSAKNILYHQILQNQYPYQNLIAVKKIDVLKDRFKII